MRKELPMLVTAIVGLLVIFGNFFQAGVDWDLDNILRQWILISTNFAILVGVLNLTRVHYGNVKRRRDTWIQSALLLAFMWFYLVLIVVQTADGETVRWLYDAIITPGNTTMFAMIAFFITSAAYRAFRIRTAEATALMIVAIIMMMGRSPIGDVIISGWSDLANWFLDIPNAAMARGVLIGGYIGMFAVAMRILLGLERGHLGGGS